MAKETIGVRASRVAQVANYLQGTKAIAVECSASKTVYTFSFFTFEINVSSQVILDYPIYETAFYVGMYLNFSNSSLDRTFAKSILEQMEWII